ncbi:MAG: hypothetical protein HGB17_03310, partial [Syntrophobacteraceae bacterium]|nr:hypothetical protein [Syntrophobacteraceae bacterium]
MPSHLHRHDEPGHIHFWTISCYRRLQFFRDDGMKQVVVAALRSLQVDLGVCLVGYVVMPEHLHVLVYPHPHEPEIDGFAEEHGGPAPEVRSACSICHTSVPT